MSFWKKVNIELKKAVDEGWTVVKDSAKLGKLRYNRYMLHRQAEKCFAEIGGIVYEMAKPPWENPLSRPAVLELVEKIKKVEAETTTIEEEMEKVRHKEGVEEKAPMA